MELKCSWRLWGIPVANDLLKWWHSERSKFPDINHVARKYLACRVCERSGK